jgi:hypothetical protein
VLGVRPSQFARRRDAFPPRVRRLTRDANAFARGGNAFARAARSFSRAENAMTPRVKRRALPHIARE